MRPNVLLVAMACVAACALLALFVAATPSAGIGPVPRLSRPAVIAGWALLALALVASLGNAIVTWVRGRRPRAPAADKKPDRLWPIIVIPLGGMVVGLALLALFLSLYKPPKMEGDIAPIASASQVEEQKPFELEEEEEQAVLDAKTIRNIVLVVAGAAALLLLVLLAIRAVRASREPEAESAEVQEGLRRELAAALRVSLEEILAEEDYRQAVIACYLRMEQGFGTAGFPRADPETPLEFLERVLREAGVAGPGVGPALAALTRLYEIARFSEHPVRPADRSEAVSCLRALEGALAGGLGARKEAGQ